MGKKDEEIARLRELLVEQTNISDELHGKNRGLAKEMDKLQVMVENGTKIINDLKAKNEGLSNNNHVLNDDIAKMTEAHSEQIEQFQEKILEMQNYPLTLNVNTTGVQDINKVCNDAVELVQTRFKELGYEEGRWKILALPHTMSLNKLK